MDGGVPSVEYQNVCRSFVMCLLVGERPCVMGVGEWVSCVTAVSGW